jgi:hypothetical protein
MENYTLTADDVAKVKEERGYRTASANEVLEGDQYPMVVVRHNDDGSVNGQVFLDGPDTLWVTSVQLNADAKAEAEGDDSETQSNPN